MEGSMVTCEDCGDKMLSKNMKAHLIKAYMHVPRKSKTSDE